MLTKEQRQELTQRINRNRLQCKDLWSGIEQLKKLLDSYYKLHSRLKEEMEKADRKLAIEDKLTKVKISKQRAKASEFSKLSKEDLLNLIKELSGDQNG